MATKTEPKPPTARQVAAERKRAESQLAIVRAQAETKLLQNLIESPQPVIPPWYERPEYDEFSQWPGNYGASFYLSSAEDRIEGRYRPLYETEQDLRRMRAQGRKFKDFFPVAEAALEALTNYVMSGCEISVQPKKKDDQFAVQMAPVVQRVVDRFLEANNFIGDLDRQIHIDSRVDGEVFATLYPQGNDVRLELTDPDFICTPLDPRPLEQHLGVSYKCNYWWHGVHTQWHRDLKRDDVAKPLGYHAVYDRTGEMWDYLPVLQVERVMRNVGRMSRRGVSDFHIILGDLANEAKIRRNTSLGAAILSAIVMIRNHAEGVSKTSIESMVSTSSTHSYQKPIQDGTRTTYSEHIQPGTVKDAPHGMEIAFGPMGTLNQPIYIEVAQYVLRIIGNRWCMPEYLISGDASNANYSSTLVAESPFVKYCEHQQEFYAAHFKYLLWKALRMYYAMGKFDVSSFGVLYDRLNIDVNYASPASRDGLQQAQENQVYCEMGILSKRTIATNAGYDYDEEQQNIARDGGCGGTCGGVSGAGGNTSVSVGGFGGGSAPTAGYAAASSSTGSGVMAGDGQLVDAVNEQGEVIGQAVISSSSSGGSTAAPIVFIPSSSAPTAPSAPRPTIRRGQTDPGRRNEFESDRTETLALRAMDLLMERAHLREREEGRWITMNGQAIKISDDGTMLTGPMKGQEVGSSDRDSKAKQTDSPEFKAWFGDSKAVDDQGSPRVVYHGTKTDFDTFDNTKLTSEKGFFFTDEPDDAGEFSDYATGRDGQNIKPVYLSLKNPLEHDYDGELYEPSTMQRLVKQARAAGHDSLIVRNIRNFEHGRLSTSYVAFTPTQIKSATGNKGTFDPRNPDVRESGSRARAEAELRDPGSPLVEGTNAHP